METNINEISKNIIEYLDNYSRRVHKIEYGLPIDPDNKDFENGHGKKMVEIVESHISTLKQRHDEAMELLGELKIDLTILKNNLSFEATQNFRFEGIPETIQKWNEKIETMINKNK